MCDTLHVSPLQSSITIAKQFSRFDVENQIDVGISYVRSRTSHYVNRININNIKTLAFAHEIYKFGSAAILKEPKYDRSTRTRQMKIMVQIGMAFYLSHK